MMTENQASLSSLSIKRQRARKRGSPKRSKNSQKLLKSHVITKLCRIRQGKVKINEKVSNCREEGRRNNSQNERVLRHRCSSHLTEKNGLQKIRLSLRTKQIP